MGEGAKEKEKIEEEHEEEKGEYKRKKDKRHEEQIAIAEAWDDIILVQVIRSFILVTHSILQKYIVLPSLIIVKIISRMLLFQFPKWMETELPFGSPRKKPFFFEPIHKTLEKNIRNVKKKGFFFLIILKDNIKGFLKILNEKIRWIIKIVLFIKIKVKELLFFFRVTRVSDPSQNEEPSQNEKDSKISNRIIHESPIRIVSRDWTNDSLIERKINDLADKKTKIWDQDIDISTNKGNFSNKRTESQKHIGWDSFMKSFIKIIYMGILLCITNIYRINVQFFLDSAKKTLNGYTYNDKIKEKDTNEMNPNIIPFISTVRSLSTYTTNISSDSNSPIYCDLSSLSQAYVFYKLFQTQVSNKYKPESTFNYYRIYPFIKDRIKDYFHDYFHTREIFDLIKIQEAANSGMINQHCTFKNNDSLKLGSYEEKDQLIHSGKKDYDKLGLLKSPNVKDSNIYGSPLQVNRHREIFNYNTHKYKLFHAITINDSLEDKYTIDRDQNQDKKYFELRITNFYPRNNMKTRTSTSIATFINKKKKTTKTGTNKKDILSLYIRIHQKSKQSKKRNLISDIRNKKKDVGANSAGSDIKKCRKKKKLKSKKEAELDFFLKKYFLFQLRWGDSFNQRMINNIKVYCLLLRLMNPNEIAISSIQRGKMGLDVMLINKDLSLLELIKREIFLIEPVRLSIKWDEISIIYQTIAISLTHKVQHQTNRGYEVKKYIDKNYFNGLIVRHEGVRMNGDNNNYDLLVPEHILSPSHHRELRIISSFNYRNRNLVNKNPIFYNKAKTNAQGFDKFINRDKHFDTNTNNSLK
ncbi:unnamed protein product [Victoria cruziana]